MPESGYAGTKELGVTDPAPEGLSDDVVGVHVDRRGVNRVRITLLALRPEAGKTYGEYVFSGPLDQGFTTSILEQAPDLIQKNKMRPRWHLAAISGAHAAKLSSLRESLPAATSLGKEVERTVVDNTKISVLSAKEKTRYLETLLEASAMPFAPTTKGDGWEATGALDELPGSGGDIGVVFKCPGGGLGVLSMVNSERCVMKDGGPPPQGIPANALYGMAFKNMDPKEKVEVKSYLHARLRLLAAIERRMVW